MANPRPTRGPLGHQCNLPNLDVCRECLIEVTHPNKGRRFFKQLAFGQATCNKFQQQQNDNQGKCPPCAARNVPCSKVLYKDGLDMARLFLAVAAQEQLSHYGGQTDDEGADIAPEGRKALHALLVEVTGFLGGDSWISRDWGRMTVEGALRRARWQSTWGVAQADVDNAYRLEWLEPDTLPADEL